MVFSCSECPKVTFIQTFLKVARKPLCVCVCVCLAEMSLVVCDREERAALLLECKEKGMTPKVSCLVLFNDFSQAFGERAKKCEVDVLYREQLMVSGCQLSAETLFKHTCFLVVPISDCVYCTRCRSWESRTSKILW